MDYQHLALITAGLIALRYIPRLFHRRRRPLPPHSHSELYTTYIHSEEWQIIRHEVISEAEHRCQHCGEQHPLDVHHLTYKRLGNERPGDLIALCRPCHLNADRKRQK